MEFITTTQLRTLSPKLIRTLSIGKQVRLVHRSKIIGTISPVEDEPKIFSAQKFIKAIGGLPKNRTTPQEREKKYRKTLEKKYGQYIS